MSNQHKITYTKTDEAPMLATYAFYPVLEAFAKCANVGLEIRDISLAARIISNFNDYLAPEQRESDALKELGEMVKQSTANVIKLPNVSASLPQIKETIAELQGQGYPLPDYPEVPKNEKETEIKERYDLVKGSAVNPVLREGNSDRRPPSAVKEYVKVEPHSMGEWLPSSTSHVASMSCDDFYDNEKSLTAEKEMMVRIEFVANGETKILKPDFPILAGEIIDSTVMRVKTLRSFLEKELKDAKESGIIFSLHLKATMMKVSDPILFGHAVTVFFKDLFDKHEESFKKLGINPNNGFNDLLIKIEQLPTKERETILKEIELCYDKQPELAMVNSDKGITNLHVPSDIIIDASMAAALRTSGQMWGLDGKLHDTKFVIPDRCYSGIYQEVITFCQKNGAFDPTKMGSVPNVGLMAQKAEEYGSHDKTFEAEGEGTIQVVDSKGTVLMEQKVEKGDVFRMCQAKDEPIRNWVSLAVERATKTGSSAIFWLDSNRAHDREMIQKVETYLKEYDTKNLDISILAPNEAMRKSLEKVKAGEECISVTGNVLRDYLTDLFPILELGTSAKMLSIVPMLQGGAMFETGAGGSAPKHVQQFVEEGHLRWDSLGEFLALAAAFERMGDKYNIPRSTILGRCLDKAVGNFLRDKKSPSRKVNELDNRGSQFYLTKYWAQNLAEQSDDTELQNLFRSLAKSLSEKEKEILAEINATQGKPIDIKGYYHPDDEAVTRAMRPSNSFNDLIAGLN